MFIHLFFFIVIFHFVWSDSECSHSGDCSAELQQSFEELSSNFLSSKFDSVDQLFSAYASFHNQVLASSKDDAKFILFTVPGQGWANRLRTFASAFLLAILSGRVFVVDWRQPVHLNVLVDAPFDWDYAHFGLASHLHPDVLSAHLIVSKGPYDKGPKDPVSGKVIDWATFESGDLAKAYAAHRIVKVTGYSAFSTAFVLNRRYKHILQLFDNECPLRDLVPYLIRPSIAVQEQLNPILEKVQGKELIALQIRIGSKENYFAAGPLGRLPDNIKTIYESDHAYQLWFKCALQAIAEDPSLLIYVATDNPFVFDLAKKVFGDNLVVYDAPIEHSGMIQPGKTDDGQLKVLVDWWMLGEATVLYRTWWSTYGYTASLRTSPTTVAIPYQYADTCELPSDYFPAEFTNHC